jgi:hypothetical protein
MKKMTLTGIRFALTLAILIILSGRGISQTVLPEILNEGTHKEQMDYIQEKTRIYEYYRAIREDMFQKIKSNSTDSLKKAKTEINGLKDINLILNKKIDSLAVSLETTKDKVNEITATKNSIKLFGMEVNKIIYNTIMWFVVAGLLCILAIGFLAFKRNLVVTNHTKKELEELKNEFEAYRKASREAREKMSMAHFNELKKLKGG